MDVDRIVAGLSDLEKEWITGWQGAGGAAFNCVAGDLRAKRLLVGPLDWTLNDLGLQVRARLTQETDHG